MKKLTGLFAAVIAVCTHMHGCDCEHFILSPHICADKSVPQAEKRLTKSFKSYKVFSV